MIPRCLSSPVSDPIYCRICLYVAPLALLYALLKIPQGDLSFAELNIHADMTVRFFVGQKNQRLDVADDYERSQNCPFSKGVTMKGLVALYLYIIARKIADRKVFPYGRQLLFPGDCYALDYAYFEVEIQGISISHNHVFDDGTEYLSVVLVQTPHIT